MQHATGNTRNMATTETRAAFARRHGVNRSTVLRWETKGRLVLTVDGLVNVEASDRLLSERAPTYRGGSAKGPRSDAAAKAVSPDLGTVPHPDPLDHSVAGLAEVVRQISAYAARMAVEFGAPLQVAYGLDQAVFVEADRIASRFLAEHGHVEAAAGIGVVEGTGVAAVEPDWPALAARCGGSFDLDALDAWFCSTPYWLNLGPAYSGPSNPASASSRTRSEVI